MSLRNKLLDLLLPSLLKDRDIMHLEDIEIKIMILLLIRELFFYLTRRFTHKVLFLRRVCPLFWFRLFHAKLLFGWEQQFFLFVYLCGGPAGEEGGSQDLENIIAWWSWDHQGSFHSRWSYQHFYYSLINYMWHFLIKDMQWISGCSFSWAQIARKS